MNPHIQKLYPEAKKIHWVYNVIRGGDQFGDQQRNIAGPHLDYHQNNSLRMEFHKEKPAFSSFADPSHFPTFESDVLIGLMDTEKSKFGVLLGVWKPIYPNKVSLFGYLKYIIRRYLLEFSKISYRFVIILWQ